MMMSEQGEFIEGGYGG